MTSCKDGGPANIQVMYRYLPRRSREETTMRRSTGLKPRVLPARRLRRAYCLVESWRSAGVPDLPYGLSESELRVLTLLTEGLSDKQVALLLGVTIYTINKHVGAILTKMQVRSRTAAAVRALRENLVPP